jgi:hypothetical protein
VLSGVRTAAGTRDLRLVLQPESVLVVHALGSSGEPVPEFLVAALSPLNNAFHARFPTPVVRGHQGSAKLTNLPSGAMAIWVVPTAGDAAAPVPLAVDLSAGSEVTVTLPPARARTLRLVDAHGAPLAWAQVELIDACGSALPIAGDLFDARNWRVLIGPTRAFLLQRGATDAAGTLLLRGPGDRELALRIHGDGLAPQVVQPIRLDVDPPLAVTATAGATWSGRLLPADVAADLRPQLPINLGDAPLELGFGLVLRQGKLRLAGPLDSLLPIERDGTLHLTELPSGTFEVAMVTPSAEFPLGSVTLQAGRELHQDLDVSMLRRSNVDLQVFIDGAPWPNVPVLIEARYGVLSGEPAWGSESLHTDAEGRLHFRSHAGLLAASLHLDNGRGDYEELPVPDALTVTRGVDLRKVLDLQLLRPRLRVLQPDGAPAAGVQLYFQNPIQRGASARATDAEGFTQSPRLCAGTFRVQARRDPPTLAAFRKLHGADAGQPIEFAWTLPADAPATLDIHLPATWDR